MLIFTKYLGPTNHKGARIKATFDDRSLTIPFDYKNDDRGHGQAAEALAQREDLAGYWICVGATREGYAFARSSGFRGSFMINDKRGGR